MLRTLALALGALSPAAAAQTHDAPLTDVAMECPVPVKHAGTYHLATHTWTRSRGTVASFGISDNIYSNTAYSGYFYQRIGPLGASGPGTILTDAGAIPGTSHPQAFPLGGATVDIHNVVEIQIAYCDMEPLAAASGWTLDFYESHRPCNFGPSPVATQTIVLSGLPSNGCWTVDIDLSAATGNGMEFPFQADGGAANPGFDGDLALDSFGVSWVYTGTGTDHAGPLICGAPALTDVGWVAGPPDTGSNTYYGDIGGCPGTGSGFGNEDSYYVDEMPVGCPFLVCEGCYWFGGYVNQGATCGTRSNPPMGGFWLEMSTESVQNPIVSTQACVGAPSATGSPAVCEVQGSRAASDNRALLVATGVPAHQFGLFATGRAQLPAMALVSGNGWVCIDAGSMGGLGRFQMAGQVKNSGANGRFSLDTSASEWSLTSIPTSNGAYAAMSGITSYFQAWFREPTGAGFNFSGSCSVTWQ